MMLKVCTVGLVMVAACGVDSAMEHESGEGKADSATPGATSGMEPRELAFLTKQLVWPGVPTEGDTFRCTDAARTIDVSVGRLRYNYGDARPHDAPIVVTTTAVGTQPTTKNGSALFLYTPGTNDVTTAVYGDVRFEAGQATNAYRTDGAGGRIPMTCTYHAANTLETSGDVSLATAFACRITNPVKVFTRGALLNGRIHLAIKTVTNWGTAPSTGWISTDSERTELVDASDDSVIRFAGNRVEQARYVPGTALASEGSAAECVMLRPAR